MSRSTKNIVIILAMSVVPMLAFQNCSGVRFVNMADATNEKTGLIADLNDDVVGEVIDEGDGSVTPPVVPPIVTNDDDSDNDSADDGIKTPPVVDNNDDDDSSPTPTDGGGKKDDSVADNDDSDDGAGSTPIVNVAPPAGGDDGGGSQVASCVDAELTDADAENDEIVQVACNGNSGKMCALICFQPNDNNPKVLTKKVNLKQVEDGGAWENGPKANGRVANASAE
jgi:hypothetical protein